jgi:hypothetical protein
MTQKICIFFLFIIKNTCFLFINTLFLQTDYIDKLEKKQIKED